MRLEKGRMGHEIEGIKEREKAIQDELQRKDEMLGFRIERRNEKDVGDDWRGSRSCQSSGRPEA